jgi:hypothetical protein
MKIIAANVTEFRKLEELIKKFVDATKIDTVEDRGCIYHFS